MKVLLEVTSRNRASKKLLQRYLEHLHFFWGVAVFLPHHLVLKPDLLRYELLNLVFALVFLKNSTMFAKYFFLKIFRREDRLFKSWSWSFGGCIVWVKTYAVVFPKVCDEHHSPLHQCLPLVALFRELLGPPQDSPKSPNALDGKNSISTPGEVL